jgi:hypothetical protein
MQWRTTCAVIKSDTRQISTGNQKPTTKADKQNSTFQHHFNRPKLPNPNNSAEFTHKTQRFSREIPTIQQNLPTKPTDKGDPHPHCVLDILIGGGAFEAVA